MDGHKAPSVRTRPLWASHIGNPINFVGIQLFESKIIMKNNPSSHRRQFYRKPGQDYSLPGYYFITMNTQNWRRLFGQKSGNTIVLNDIGNMIKSVWLNIPERFPNVILDEYIIMPDHFHAIIQLKEINSNKASIDPRDRNLAKIIGAFKSISTVKYIHGVKQKGWAPFNDKLWHFRFYDRIINNSKSLEYTRNYIIENPSKWNPKN